MNDMDYIMAVFPYVSGSLFILGTALRIIHWLRQPAHVKWTLYPVPVNVTEQLTYMLKEILTFGTVYQFNRRLWIGTYSLHMAMAGFVIFSLAYVAGMLPSTAAKFFLLLMLVAACYIIWLRLVDRNLRALSSGEEFFNLAFIAVVAAAAFFTQFLEGYFPPRYYIMSLITFAPDTAFISRAQLVVIFLGGLFFIYLPWSKMIHYVAKYFTYHRINWQSH
ncbi:MAG: sulfate reduction electron transfer complex DsrMKJOP subunit DsrM [Syntrophus sp. SKADARSKE-3]|nr:sulfate reduction electron transfer complex DsrMKJOP subunit DsrM [Syntrophus sp. SKADARSKE-3]